jgi:hypothetical protein
MDGKLFELQMQIKDTEKSISEYQSKIECHRKEKEKAEKEMHQLLCETCSAYSKMYTMYVNQANTRYGIQYDSKTLLEEMMNALKQWLVTEYNPNLFKNRVDDYHE